MTIRYWIASVVIVLFGWISLQLVVLYFTDAAPGAMVLFPKEGFISRLPAHTAIVGMGDFWVIIASEEPALEKKLYAAGALIVLPTGLPGCFPIS